MNVKDLVAQVMDRLERQGVDGIYVVFNEPPEVAVVVDEGDRYRLELPYGKVVVRVRVRKNGLEPYSVEWWI